LAILAPALLASAVAFLGAMPAVADADYSATVLADNPVSYWRLGENAGTVAADERNANPGTYLNSPTLGATSLLATDTANTAVSFDGVNDTVKVPSSASLELGSSLSLEAWIKPTSLPASGSFASVMTKAESYSLQFNGPSFEFTIMQNGNRRRLQAPGAIAAGQTYHVVGTYDGTTQRLYVNGILAASAVLSNGPPSTNSNAFYIGSWDGAHEFFKGTIDEAAVYGTTLSPTRIAAHYTAGSGKEPPPSYSATVLPDNPVSYWRLGESAGTVAADERGANAGTYLNSPTLWTASLLSADTANKAVSFDGTNDSVKVADSATLDLTSPLSLEAWIKPTSLPASGSFASILTKAEAYALQFNGPQLEFTVMQSGTRKRCQAPSGAIVAGNAYYVAGTYDGTTQRLYVNGVLAASCALTGPASVNANPLYIGSWDGTKEFFKGTIDEAAVYGTTLSASRVAAHYEAGADPPQTTITSAQPSYTSHEEPPIEFTSDEAGSAFKCSLDDPKEEPKTTCTSPYKLPEHLAPGWHTFVVAATDSEGHTDPTPTKWTFNTDIYPPAPSTSKLVYPEDGKKTASYYTLKAEWGAAPEGGGVTGVTFQMELPKWDVFKDVPEECTIDGEGQPASWPLPVTSNPGHSEPVFLKVKGCAPFAGVGYLEEQIKFRAVFDGGKNAAGASEPATTEFIRVYNTSRITTDATESVGPATLDLLTGDITISRTDVSIPVPGSEANLEFTRVYDSTIGNNLPGYSTVLGGWWQPSAPVEQEYEGEAWVRLKEQVIPATPAVFEKECWNKEGETVACGAGCPPDSCEEWEAEEAQPEERWMELFDNEGGSIPFEISGSSYISPDYAKELKLTREDSEHIVLSDPNGTHTTFTMKSSREYLPGAVSFQASPTSERMVYEPVGHYEGLRLMRIIGPTPAGVENCGDWTSIETKGCRTLKLEYLPKNKWAQSHEAYPEWEVALASIRYYDATGEKEKPHYQVVAEYNYGPYLELTEEWDPRLPNLKEKYGYKVLGSGRLTSLTPPGESPWEFEYEYKSGCCTGEARLKKVSRASLVESAPTATTTIAYEVPLSGEDAPYDMSPESVAEWGQTDFPVDTTAIFPPNHVPGEYPPSDYSGATIHYMDPEGHEVNTASPSPPGVEGATITTTETDVKGNVVRELSPQNRLTALAAGKESVARSHELDSHSTYSVDGTEMLESWGPLHKVRLESGETVEARAHTTTKYDEGAPELKEGETAPRLPTKETVTTAIPSKEDIEPRVSETHYDWTLRKPTEAITDPEGLNLITKTVYNSSGQVKEERQPSNSGGGGAGTTKTFYWSAGGNAEYNGCGNKPAWAGLPCLTHPAAPPSPSGGNPELPWTWFINYSSLDQPTEIWEQTGGFLKRTTTLTYDSAGRPVKTKQTGEGTSVPASETLYSSATGRPYQQRFVCEAPETCTGFDNQALTTTYDSLGRPIKYEDADGNVSGFAYDLLSRPVTVSDGKGTQVVAYDVESGVPTEMTDSAAGTFKASYNATGQMTEQLLPDGLAQKISYDPEGTAVSLQYVKETNCSSACTWLSFSREDSIRGQVLREESTLANEEYTYDKAGRLTLAKETPTGEGCTTRSYAFDKDSNRTSLTTRKPKEGGACDTSSEGSKQTYSYDTADRLIGEGVKYDNLGRITSLPAKYSGGGILTTSYYVNDLTRSQTQDGVTNTYNLDSALRERERVRTGGSEAGTAVYHYAGGSDSPAWTQEGSAWTRSIAAMGGSLGALQKSSGEITLQLANMHGDVVATASINPAETKLLSTQRFDEFGNPKQTGFLQGGNAEYNWLGAKGRRTQLPSGVIQMGVRSYVPAMGRFLSPDPIPGGSANAYEYSGGDPVNNFDLTGEKFCSRVHGAEVCGQNGKQLRKQIKAYKGRFQRERRAAARVSRGRKTIVLQYNSKGATTSSIGSILEKAADKVIDAVGGGTKKMINGVMRISFTGPEYKAASKAFKLAGAWDPSRLVQYWQCGSWLAGDGGDCDPFEMATGIKTESAR
jgi:RHS repeat-associated protein